MMTKSTDYQLYSPPSAHIKGEIIPTADIDNIAAPDLRFEDYHYLREMKDDFTYIISSTNYPSYPNEYDYLTLATELKQYYEGVQNIYYRTNFSNLKLSAIPNDGLSTELLPAYYDYPEAMFERFKTNKPEYFVQFPYLSDISSHFSTYEQFNGDDLRTLYYVFNSRDLYWPLYAKNYQTSLNKYSFQAASNQSTFDIYDYDSDIDGNITRTTTTLQFQTSGAIQLGYGRDIYINQLVRKGLRTNYQYKTLPGLDHTDLWLKLDFSNKPIKKGFAVYGYYFWNYTRGVSYEKCFWKLVPLQNDGGNIWKMKFIDQNILKSQCQQLGIPYEETDWSSTAPDVWYIKIYSIGIIFSQLADNYVWLPDTWTWTPAQST